MPGFAESFWSADYAAGLGVLFGKLQQGAIENRQVLTLARLRADAEDAYGTKLGEIAPASDRLAGTGFNRDDGATVRKAYDGVRQEMEDASKSHKKIAQNIRDLVVNPFSRWCDAHDSRIQESQDDLQARIKAHDRQADAVKKLRSNYFNKCRLVEDLEEENKLAFQDPEMAAVASPKVNVPAIKLEREPEPEELEDEPYEIGEQMYSPEQVKKMLAHMINKIKMVETKVPILGTYPNTSSGSDIVEYLQQEMGANSISFAEKIGQDLVDNGFLRLIGNVGSTFANTSKMFYQWRPKAWQIAGIPEKKLTPSARTFSMPAGAGQTSPVDDTSSPVVGTVTEYLQGWNVISSGPANETPTERLHRESRETDDRYKSGVRKLDQMRCELEEAIFAHLRFLERCELDRLKAVKTVILDFSGTISNVIPSMQSTVDKMMLFQETVQPLSDLRYMLENYRTGSFVPRVVTYENYYNKVDEQTFGVDLEARARADKKRVPLLVTTILTYLDQHYPDLEGDEARRNVWLVDVPLSMVHKLRTEVNTGKPPAPEVLAKYDIPTIAALLKLYLLELPDSLVSSHVYEIIRQLYTHTVTAEASSSSRVSALQTTLSQLRLANVATLDACMNHLTRLIELTSADEPYITSLATALAPCVLRPRQETQLTLEEKHAYRLLRDLFEHKDPIFAELKRMAMRQAQHSATPPPGGPNNGPGGAGGSLGGGPGSVLGGPGGAGGGSLGAKRDAPNRPRAISTDESNRRANVEERNRLLLEKSHQANAGERSFSSRSRATSPAPSPRHRRDRSTGGSATRFPIQVASPTAATGPGGNRASMGSVVGGPKRQSLEVPGESPPGSRETFHGNGGAIEELKQEEAAAGSPTVLKRNSMGRGAGAATRFVGGRRVTVGKEDKPVTAGSPVQRERKDTLERAPVTLVDRPMDD